MSSKHITRDAEFLAMLTERGLDEMLPVLQGFSLLSSDRLKPLIRYAEETMVLGGSSAEVGCAAGGTSALICALAAGRRHWACDTFQGLLDAAECDPDLSNGDFGKIDVAAVRARLAPYPQCEVVPGFFPDSAPPEMLEARYAFAHVDVDTYGSILNCFRFFESRMLPGGIVIVDDVVNKGPRGAKLAWVELLDSPAEEWRVIETHDPAVVVRFG